MPAGAKGNELERAAKEETDALVPRHTYVPWFVVNGVPLLDGYASLQTFICVALPSDSRSVHSWDLTPECRLHASTHLERKAPGNELMSAACTGRTCALRLQQRWWTRHLQQRWWTSHRLAQARSWLAALRGCWMLADAS
jgi:hypothetical protein